MVNTAAKGLSASQLREFESFGSKINKLGVNFAVCNADGELVLLLEGGAFNSSKQSVIDGCLSVMRDGSMNCESPITDDQFLTAVLRRGSKTAGAALIDLGDKSRCSLEEACHEVQQDVRSVILCEMLSLLAENFEAKTQAEEQIEMVGTELAQTYEELVLLHKLSTNMKLTESDANFLQMACDSLTEIVSVEGIAVVLEKSIEDERRMVVAAGSGLIDINEPMVAVLHSRLAEEIDNGKEALLDSEVDSPFKYEWSSSVKNIIAVPLCGKDKAESHLAARTPHGNSIIGLMVAVNRIDKQDFDSTDIKLFNSVANGCAVFVENGRLFRDLQELFIGSLKALTRSIDAKDQYTRGHSERVAYISRWIAERLNGQESLDEEDINRIYLAGLLHDMGKIGIDEAVLCKKGKLTEEEFDLIRQHPSIGAGILREIRQMWDIVPGVLYHHERIDGKGYPNGLTGDRIPLMAKIIGLADSFDAMTSKRTYRDAMTVEQALAEIERSLGSQFDKEVGGVFINSDVRHLWNMMQEAFKDVYGNGSSVEYGAAAVGTLIR